MKQSSRSSSWVFRRAKPAALLDDAVSAATVSNVCKVLDDHVGRLHRRKLEDPASICLLDGVSVRLRLVGAVQRGWCSALTALPRRVNGS